MISRRKFIRQSLVAAGTSAMLPIIPSCAPVRKIKGSIKGPNAELGHRLRNMDFPSPTKEVKTNIVIVGGGVAGLSAARYLSRHTTDFKLLELNSAPGGNSLGGSNAHSAYPWGAHYLPIPGTNDPELIKFLKEINVITGEENGLPVFNEYYLCFEPKERLYIDHFWQDGLVPQAGIPSDDRKQIERFMLSMHRFRELRGSDGKEAFTIPVDESSQDETFLAYDHMSMAQYLDNNGFHSDYLKWYVNYCCADDFGSSVENTSAWAGIHYFASRKGKAANAEFDTVLTWPEGNSFLVNALKKEIARHIITDAAVFDVRDDGNEVAVSYFDAKKNESTRIICSKVILATPQFLTQRILQVPALAVQSPAFEYAPWMVANITVESDLDERRGQPLSWDNVFYGSRSMGYVTANHQHVSIRENKKVITYYLPLTGDDVKTERHAAYGRTYEEWTKMILDDLHKPHPKIEDAIIEMDIWLWGHGMIRPGVGFIWGDDRKKYNAAQSDRILKAHSDMSGISIFEEAFYRGHVAAKRCLQSL